MAVLPKTRLLATHHLVDWDYGDGSLTPTQLDVLTKLASGWLLKEVAYSRGINIRTAKQHLAACRYKLNARTTVDACCIAIRRGLISKKTTWTATSAL